MSSILALQSPFCLQCDTLLINEPCCPSCGWNRPNHALGEGDVVWSLPLEGRFVKPYHLPALHEEIFITCIENKTNRHHRTAIITAVDLVSSRVIWSKKLQTGRVARFLEVANNVLFVGSENLEPIAKESNSLLALDPKTGAEIWSFDVLAHSLSTPAIIENTAFFISSGGVGYGVDILTGRPRWQLNDLAISWSFSPPTAGKEYFYLGGRTSSIKRITPEGELTQFFEVPDEKDWFDTPLCFYNDVIYAVCRNKQLYAIDAKKHKIKWETPIGRGATAQPMVGRYVYLPIKEVSPRTYCLRALSVESGDLIWQFESNRHFELPATTDELVTFIGNNDRNFYALNSSTGQKLWQLDLESKVRTIPLLLGNHICLGTDDGKLHFVHWKTKADSPQLTANQYRDLEQWALAGTVAISEGDLLGAAKDFEQSGALYKAAQLYEKEEAIEVAAKLYLQSGHYNQSAKIYNLIDDKQGEANALLGLKQFEKAAQLYVDLSIHDRAAEIYRDGGHLNRAAAHYHLAGKFIQSAEIYKELGRLELAADMYEKANETDLAVEIWMQIDKPHQAAFTLESASEFARAASLLESEGYIDNAAAIWLRQDDVEKAADIYQRAKRWVQAAELHELINNREDAAYLYEQGGKLQKAAKLFLANLQFGKAAELFLQSQDAYSAAHAFESEKNWRRAAQLYLSLKPPLYKNAGQCYEKIEAWQEAANAYEDGKLYQDAVRTWLLYGKVKQAAHLLHQLGDTSQAARLLEAEGEHMEAAELYLERGNLNEAVHLFHLAGNDEKALEILSKYEAWDAYRELAVKLKRYEREAEACVALAEQSTRDAAYKLHQAAAQAFERAAQKYEEENTSTRTDEEIARIWLKAAEYFKLVNVTEERVANCIRQASRLRQLPEIVIEVKAQNQLVVNEFHRLRVRMKNIGYGYAFDVTFKVINDEFESDLQFTQDFAKTLPPDQMKEILFPVKPKTSGSSVPMKILLTFSQSDETKIERTIGIEVRVRQPSSKFSSFTQAGQPSLIDMYQDTGYQLSAILILAKKIDHFYSLEELRHLTFSLNIEWENLAGTTRVEKAFSTVQHCYKRDRLSDLIEKLKVERPMNIDWWEGIEV